MAREDFEGAVLKLEEAYKDALGDFVTWCQKHWKMPPKDKKWPFEGDIPPSDEYRNGYDAALEGLYGALEAYSDDMWVK